MCSVCPSAGSRSEGRRPKDVRSLPAVSACEHRSVLFQGAHVVARVAQTNRQVAKSVVCDCRTWSTCQILTRARDPYGSRGRARSGLHASDCSDDLHMHAGVSHRVSRNLAASLPPGQPPMDTHQFRPVDESDEASATRHVEQREKPQSRRHRKAGDHGQDTARRQSPERRPGGAR
jgi:hypothetical protein